MRRCTWVKKLYVKQTFPDNFTDKSFLKDFTRNERLNKVSYKEATLGSIRVTVRFCLCIIFASIYVSLKNKIIDMNHLLIFVLFTFITGHLASIKCDDTGFFSTFTTKQIWLTFLFTVLGYLVSPMLYNLTNSISNDSINSMAAIMFLIHLISFDYGLKSAIVSDALSTNCAVFASVCLVSRLASELQAFILLVVAFIIFVLSKHYLKMILNTNLFYIFFLLTLVVTVLSVFAYSVLLAVYLSVVVSLINLYLPYLFVRWQKYKNNVNGPWNEAIIDDYVL